MYSFLRTVFGICCESNFDLDPALLSEKFYLLEIGSLVLHSSLEARTMHHMQWEICLHLCYLFTSPNHFKHQKAEIGCYSSILET